MSTTIAPETVREKFGPPSYLETLLADISSDKGKINEALTSFLTLPYVNAIKVTDREGAEISLYDQVNALKKKYEGLQARSVPIVQEISAYARFSELLLPHVAKPDGLTLEDFLTTNTPLVMKYGQEAKVLAGETDALKREFQDLLEVLEHNLAEVLKQIGDQEQALEEAEKEYQFEKVTAIISGIITLGFLIGAGVALCLGAVPVALELGVHAGLSLYETIKAAIKVSGLAKVIVNLKAAIATSKETKKNLEVLIPAFKNIVEMLQKVGTAWDNIQAGLADVEDHYLAWSNPKFFTDEMLAATLDAWGRVRKAAESYIIVVTGAREFAVEDSVIKSMKLTAFTAPSNATGMAAIGAAYEVAKYNMDVGVLQSIFCAPEVRGRVLQPYEIDQLIDQYKITAKQLEGTGQIDVAQQCDRIGEYANTFVLPGVQAASRELSVFASRQPEIPPTPISQEEWGIFCDKRIYMLEHGREMVRAAYGNVHNLQFQTANLNNLLIARVHELLITRERVEYEIQKAEYERMQQEVELRRIPYAWVLKKIIDELTGNIQRLTVDRQKIEMSLLQLDRVLRIVEQSQQNIAGLSQLNSTLEVVYNDLLTGMTSAAIMWPAFHRLKLRPAELALYKATWEAVRGALGAW